MVLFRYLLISLLLTLLNQRINLVQCSPQECKFDVESKILDCSDRNLTRIPYDLFSSEHAKIKLANNPFVCDCNLSWFLESIENTKSKNRSRIIDLETLKCGSPDRFRSQYLVKLNREDACSSLPELSLETAANISTMEPISAETTPFTEPDPCKQSTVHCNPHTEICVRSERSYACQCKPGFKRKSEAGECEASEVFDACLGKNNCSEHAQCINEIGSYTCICKSGYVGDGVHCKDKDECEDKDSNECHKYAVCINEDGGYKCRCRRGFEQHKQGKVCIKKNEISTKTFVLAGLIAGIPFLTFVALTIYVCRRRIHRRTLARQVEYSPEEPPLDDIMPSDNQQLIPEADSYYEENIPMKGLPPSQSAWSEWPDYDDTRGSDSD